MSTALEWKTKGNAALSAGNNSEAIDCYSQAIELDNTQHVFYSNRSAAYLSNKETEKALEDAENCIKLKSDWSKGYARKGAALHSMQKYGEALEAYEAGLAIDKNNAGCLNGIQEVKTAMQGQNPFGQLFSGDLKAKISSNPKIAHLANDAAFMAQLEMVKNNPSSINQCLQDPRMMQCITELMGLGGMMDQANQKGKQEEASASKKEEKVDVKVPEPEPMDISEEDMAAKKIKDEALEAKTRGNGYYKKKEFAKAIEAYEEAISLDDTNMSFYTNLAAVQFELEKYDECIEQCKKAIQIGRNHRADYAVVAKAYVRIGNAYMKKGGENITLAIEAYETAQVENRTRDVDLKIKAAQAGYKKAMAQAYINPELGLAAKEDGNTKFKSGDFPAAVAAYSEAIKRDPTNPVYYANRAAAYTKLTSFNEAKADCDKSLELDPKYVKAWSRLAAIQCFMKEFHKALESYQKGLDLEPTNQDCKDGLQRVSRLIQQSQAGEVDKERASRGMADPEVQAILRDPVMQNVLQDFQTDPRGAQRHLQDAGIMAKIEKLIAAGVLQTK